MIDGGIFSPARVLVHGCRTPPGRSAGCTRRSSRACRRRSPARRPSRRRSRRPGCPCPAPCRRPRWPRWRRAPSRRCGRRRWWRRDAPAAASRRPAGPCRGRSRRTGWRAMHHARRLGLDGVVEALLAVVGRRGADGAFELDDLALAAGLLDRPIGDALAFVDEVGADEGEVVDAGLGERRIDVAVDQEHRDAGLLGVHHGGDQRLLLARREEDEVDALRDHAVDVGDLLGGGAGGVGVDELAAALGGLVLHARGLREAPGIVALGLREADLVFVLLLQRRDFGRTPGGSSSRGDAAGVPINNVCV